MLEEALEWLTPSRVMSRRCDRRALVTGYLSCGFAMTAATRLQASAAPPGTWGSRFNATKHIARTEGLDQRAEDELLELWRRAGVFYDFAPLNGIYRPAPAVDLALLQGDLDLYSIVAPGDVTDCFPNFTTVTGVEPAGFGSDAVLSSVQGEYVGSSTVVVEPDDEPPFTGQLMHLRMFVGHPDKGELTQFFFPMVLNTLPDANYGGVEVAYTMRDLGADNPKVNRETYPPPYRDTREVVDELDGTDEVVMLQVGLGFAYGFDEDQTNTVIANKRLPRSVYNVDALRTISDWQATFFTRLQDATLIRAAEQGYMLQGIPFVEFVPIERGTHITTDQPFGEILSTIPSSERWIGRETTSVRQWLRLPRARGIYAYRVSPDAS
jgi:hypothetical protein